MEYDPNTNQENSQNEQPSGGYTYTNEGSYNNENNGPEKERKNRTWGCLPIFLAVAVLTALLVMLFIQLGKTPGYNDPYGWDQRTTPPFSTESPADINDPGSASPQLTPAATNRPAPTLDGEAPQITDTSNPFPEIYEAASQGVVGIYNYAGGRFGEQLQGSGSGFLFSSEGYILTNAHVIEDASRVTVLFPSDEEVEAELIGFDQTTDLAVLKVSDPNGELIPLYIGSSNDVRVGEFVIAIGDPSGRELASTATFGMISAVSRSINIDGQTNEYLQTDAAVNPGNSGGPLINNRGEVIGVISAKTVTASYDEYGNAISAEGLGFAIPIDNAMEIAEKLITSGHITRPGIGVSVIQGDAESLEGTDLEHGLIVHAVTPGGPADKAGLEEEDIIVSCDGMDIKTSDEFIKYIRTKDVGDEITIRYYRDGDFEETVLEIGDLNNMG